MRNSVRKESFSLPSLALISHGLRLPNSLILRQLKHFSATSALQDSIKQKAAEERLEKETNAMKAKPLEFSGSDTENKFRVTKEKDDSLKVISCE